VIGDPWKNRTPATASTARRPATERKGHGAHRKRAKKNGAPRMESNLRPAAYKAAALATELTEHGAGLVNRTSGLPFTGPPLPTELNQQKLTNGRASCRAPHKGAAVYARPILDVSLCQTARPKGRMHAKSPQWPAPRGPTRSCRPGVLGHLPLSRLVRRRGWPCAGYSGFVNPSSGVFVCWNKISTHECSQSLGRLVGRAAVVVTRYERIERMVPHRV
jgi:hypothetical protein